jgi:AraC-like DNA-binding protein
MHVVFRLAGHPLRLFRDDTDSDGRVIGGAVVGGARASFYIREVSKPLCSVGAQLRPGAARALFGAGADELAGRHTPLGDLWGARVAAMREQLEEASSAERRLALLERMLMARLPRVCGLDPGVAQALEGLLSTSNVHDLVRQSGYSHRTFISMFSRSVGLTPKLYSRVLRFQQAIRRAFAGGEPWVEVAVAAGYSDQSHFNRDFREFAGVTPGEYRGSSPVFSHHLPVHRCTL